MKTWAVSMVRNWRTLAEIPDGVSDDAIFAVIDREDLQITNSTPPDEANAQIAYLRRELGL